MKVGDTAYIVESNRYVREVEICRCSGGMFLVRFTDSGGGIQVKAHRRLQRGKRLRRVLRRHQKQRRCAEIRMTDGIEGMVK